MGLIITITNVTLYTIFGYGLISRNGRKYQDVAECNLYSIILAYLYPLYLYVKSQIRESDLFILLFLHEWKYYSSKNSSFYIIFIYFLWGCTSFYNACSCKGEALRILAQWILFCSCSTMYD